MNQAQVLPSLSSILMILMADSVSESVVSLLLQKKKKICYFRSLHSGRVYLR